MKRHLAGNVGRNNDDSNNRNINLETWATTEIIRVRTIVASIATVQRTRIRIEAKALGCKHDTCT